MAGAQRDSRRKASAKPREPCASTGSGSCTSSPTPTSRRATSIATPTPSSTCSARDDSRARGTARKRARRVPIPRSPHPIAVPAQPLTMIARALAQLESLELVARRLDHRRRDALRRGLRAARTIPRAPQDEHDGRRDQPRGAARAGGRVSRHGQPREPADVRRRGRRRRADRAVHRMGPRLRQGGRRREHGRGLHRRSSRSGS